MRKVPYTEKRENEEYFIKGSAIKYNDPLEDKESLKQIVKNIIITFAVFTAFMIIIGLLISVMK
jgi:hypothetical protein